MVLPVVAIATTAERIILLPPFLFGLVVCTASLFVSRSSTKTQSVPRLDPEDETLTVYPLACLLEDAPATVLKGQAYLWATPLMSPLACCFEDAPPGSLQGQACRWATPLMSPLACCFEDAPPGSLQGQACRWATPLISPFACVVEGLWLAFYREHLGQKGIHYWDWRNQPFVQQVKPELSLLLDLPEATGATRQILTQLARPSSDWPLGSRQQFQVWHNIALSRYGQTRLSEIYQVCYGADWDTIEKLTAIANTKILDPKTPWWQVLGVAATASPSQVEKAYKQLLKRWHPDLNPYEEATLITARINGAYEQFKTRQTPKPRPVAAKSSVSLRQLFQKGLGWLRQR